MEAAIAIAASLLLFDVEFSEIDEFGPSCGKIPSGNIDFVEGFEKLDKEIFGLSEEGT